LPLLFHISIMTGTQTEEINSHYPIYSLMQIFVLQGRFTEVIREKVLVLHTLVRYQKVYIISAN